MPEIVLTTLNAKYIHAAFGLRYLLANLGALQSCARIREFDINQRPLDIAEVLLAQNPKLIGFGVYIWNVTQTEQVISIIKRVQPRITIILGGPEVSYETECQQIVQLADYVITGEADLKFAELCQQVLSGKKPANKVIPAEPPEFAQLAFPYCLYDEQDVAHRIIYVEASRGCPFSCEFCLSSLEIPVRKAPLLALLEQLQALLERGVKHFKFVDRTFNLDLGFSQALLEFFLKRHQPGQFYHFEMIPDRLPSGLREIVARFPPGSLQFEVGVQTFNPEVATLISRRQNYARLEENFRFLTSETTVHVHADLIAGLPGESLESFGAGFDRLVALHPQEIQVGILKRLRGTPIVRHDSEWEMRYDPNPPYEILQNRLLDFATMQILRRFARYWDLVGNSGNFRETTPLIWSNPNHSPIAPSAPPSRSPFHAFLRWTQWLHARVGRTDGIALLRLMELLFEFLTGELGLDAKLTAGAMWRDYRSGGRRDKPGFLKDFLAQDAPLLPHGKSSAGIPKRQARYSALLLKEQGALAQRSNRANIEP